MLYQRSVKLWQIDPCLVAVPVTLFSNILAYTGFITALPSVPSMGGERERSWKERIENMWSLFMGTPCEYVLGFSLFSPRSL